MKIVSDPVYSDIQEKPTRAKEKLSTKMKTKFSGSSFATSVSTAVSQPAEKPSSLLLPVQQQSHFGALCFIPERDTEIK